MKRFKHFGPIEYFRINSKQQHKHFISAWLRGYPNSSFGWEWGNDNTPSNPSICIRVLHFNIFSFESYSVGGYTVFILGFWWMK